MMYVCSVAIAMAGLQVSVQDIEIEAGQDVHVLAHVENNIGDVDYYRFIDGVSLEGVSTQGLDLSRETYTSLFPDDASDVVTRTLMVTATDSVGSSSDTASVSIVYEQAICGDGIVADTEECDDGNTTSSDGCSEQCLCEGMCVSMIQTHLLR